MANFDKENYSRTPKSLGLEVDHTAQRGQEVKYLNFQLRGQKSSSTQSISRSNQELTAMGKTSSQDQCASSDSVHDESYGKHGQHTNPGLFLCNPEMSMNASQADISQPIAHYPYAYPDPYLSGLFTAYGPHTVIQPQVVAAASGRVPLPVDLPEDGPIYVNAKQYHGILRRRQTRAKLEAQNKFVKTRRPYLHESRHQHALNRVRGTGGRFLSSKKSQESDSNNGSQTASGSYNLFKQNGNISNARPHQVESNKREAPPSVSEGAMRVSGGDAIFQSGDGGRYSNVPSHMAVGNGGLVYNGNRHYASIVR